MKSPGPPGCDCMCGALAGVLAGWLIWNMIGPAAFALGLFFLFFLFRLVLRNPWVYDSLRYPAVHPRAPAANCREPGAADLRPFGVVREQGPDRRRAGIGARGVELPPRARRAQSAAGRFSGTLMDWAKRKLLPCQPRRTRPQALRAARRLRCRRSPQAGRAAPGVSQAKSSPRASLQRQVALPAPTLPTGLGSIRVLHFFIQGRVQGVAFRWCVHREA